MGRGGRDRTRVELGEGSRELGEGRGGGGWGTRLGESGIGIVRWVDGILEGEERVGEMV